MSREMAKLINTRASFHNPRMERRAHLRQYVTTSPTESSIITISATETPRNPSPKFEQSDIAESPEAEISTQSSDTILATATTYLSSEDLPISYTITEAITTIVLVVGKIEYIFEVEKFQCGQLSLTTALPSVEGFDIVRNIDVRKLSSEAEEKMPEVKGNKHTQFCLHDGRHKLWVMASWGEDRTQEGR
jgi:hypothetical protein